MLNSDYFFILNIPVPSFQWYVLCISVELHNLFLKEQVIGRIVKGPVCFCWGQKGAHYSSIPEINRTVSFKQKLVFFVCFPFAPFIKIRRDKIGNFKKLQKTSLNLGALFLVVFFPFTLCTVIKH